MFYKGTGMEQSVLYARVWTHRALLVNVLGREKKRKNRRLLHRGLERRTAHGRHRIPQHVNSKHRT